MKVHSAVVVARRSMELQSFDLPSIGPDEGLLKVEMCGVCGSDPRIFDWTDASRWRLQPRRRRSEHHLGLR